MGITQDGYASNLGFNTGGITSGSVTFSNTNAGDVIEIVIYAESGTLVRSGVTVSSVTSPNLTWTRRKAITLSQGPNPQDSILEKWYAVASGVLTNEVISFTLSAGMDAWTAFARGWSGVNTSAPYDTNASLPATNTSTTNASPNVSGASTTANNTVMTADFGASSTAAEGQAQCPSGFTLCGARPETFGGNEAAECVGAYQVETSPQSNLTVTYQTGLTVATWLMMVDALQATVVAGANAKSQAVSVGF